MWKWYLDLSRRLLQPKKHPSLMPVTPDGILISVRLQYFKHPYYVLRPRYSINDVAARRHSRRPDDDLGYDADDDGGYDGGLPARRPTHGPASTRRPGGGGGGGGGLARPAASARSSPSAAAAAAARRRRRRLRRRPSAAAAALLTIVHCCYSSTLFGNPKSRYRNVGQTGAGVEGTLPNTGNAIRNRAS